MRKALILVVLCLALPAVVLAQPKQTLSFFLSDISRASADERDQWPGGFGVAFERSFAPHWSAEGAIAVERHHSYPYVVLNDGSFLPIRAARFQTFPIDVTARYHWLNDSRWKPYLGAGGHYIAAANADSSFRYRSHFDGEVNGGMLFMFTPAVGVMLDGRLLLGDREPYDSGFKVSAGLSWRF